MKRKTNDMPLRGERVSLRAVEPADLDMLFLLENDTGSRQSSFATAPASRQMIWQYINDYQADIFAEKQLRLVITDNTDGKAVGTIDISDFNARDRRGFVGICIIDDMRGRGYGSEALALLCDYARQTLGMHQLAAVVAIDNEASKALFDSAGFATAGRLRSWLRSANHYTDVLLYQRLFT